MNKLTETPNIALDIETLSTQPTAAIISIAARVFTFTAESPVCCDSVATEFTALVSATSCAMDGLHFDMDTVRWWSEQSSLAKAPFEQLTGQEIPIIKALDGLTTFIEHIRALSPDNKILVWCQGTDFDIPILRNAYNVVWEVREPWHRHEIRDARTFIHTTIGLIRPDVQDPYSLIPKNPNWHPHEALSDVDQLIWNVLHVQQLFNDHLRHVCRGNAATIQ